MTERSVVLKYLLDIILRFWITFYLIFMGSLLTMRLKMIYTQSNLNMKTVLRLKHINPTNKQKSIVILSLNTLQ